MQNFSICNATPPLASVHPSVADIPAQHVPTLSSTTSSLPSTSGHAAQLYSTDEVLSKIFQHLHVSTENDRKARNELFSLAVISKKIGRMVMGKLYRSLEVYSQDGLEQLASSTALGKFDVVELYVRGTEGGSDSRESRKCWIRGLGNCIEKVSDSLEHLEFVGKGLPIFEKMLFFNSEVFPQLRTLTLSIGSLRLPHFLPSLSSLKTLVLKVTALEHEDPTLQVIVDLLLWSHVELLDLQVEVFAPLSTGFQDLDDLSDLVDKFTLDLHGVMLPIPFLPRLLLSDSELNRLSLFTLPSAKYLDYILSIAFADIRELYVSVVPEASDTGEHLEALSHFFARPAVKDLAYVEILCAGRGQEERLEDHVNRLEALWTEAEGHRIELVVSSS